jgi:hypothetical protein
VCRLGKRVGFTPSQVRILYPPQFEQAKRRAARPAFCRFRARNSAARPESGECDREFVEARLDEFARVPHPGGHVVISAGRDRSWPGPWQLWPWNRFDRGDFCLSTGSYEQG